jgi:hypothetical protein
MYTIVIKVTSDSGDGGYTEKILVANCSFKKGKWYDGNSDEIKKRFHTGHAGCKVKVMSFTLQEQWIKC